MRNLEIENSSTSMDNISSASSFYPNDQTCDSALRYASLDFLKEVVSVSVYDTKKLVTFNPAYVFGSNHLDLPNTIDESIASNLETQGCSNPDIWSLGTLEIFKIAHGIKNKKESTAQPVNKRPLNIPETKNTKEKHAERIARFVFTDPCPSLIFSIIRPSKKHRKNSRKNVVDLTIIPHQSRIGSCYYFTKVFAETSFFNNFSLKHQNASPTSNLFDTQLRNVNNLPLLDHQAYNFKLKRTILKIDGVQYATILHYTPERDRKYILNQQFAKMFPYVHITLTKLRSIKQKIYLTGHKEYVRKYSRKGIAGIISSPIVASTLLYAVKLYEDHRKKDFYRIINSLSTEFRIPYKSVIEYEFVVLYALNFGSKIPAHNIIIVINQVKAMLKKKKRLSAI
ncbi:hypothetical protein HZS_6558 [Henneguya salminicola]|nr:hypothetical protein HZS_6558 [Henneguya salminicola]